LTADLQHQSKKKFGKESWREKARDIFQSICSARTMCHFDCRSATSKEKKVENENWQEKAQKIFQV